eukprot:2409050-Amphidinium_carterae.1
MVPGWAVGQPHKDWVRPAMAVVPMGFNKGSVSIVQAAVRNIVFQQVGVQMETEVRKDCPFPAVEEGLSLIYLDSFDCSCTTWCDAQTDFKSCSCGTCASNNARSSLPSLQVAVGVAAR